MKPSLSEVHPELRSIAQRLPHFHFTPINLWLVRMLMNGSRGQPSSKELAIENIFIPRAGDRAPLRIRVYRPAGLASPAPALIWLHGGGYIMGKPEIDDSRCVHYARELGIVVVSVDYRFAPEHAFPAPLEDCYTALSWAAAQLGIDARRIALGGESAGGGLAAALAQLARDRDEVKPVLQLLVYPMLDDRSAVRSPTPHPARLVWSRESNRFGWESYLGGRGRAGSPPPYAVPARRADLSGLPPGWIGVGTLDLFHDEDVAYARRLRDSGVDCETLVVPGAFHGFESVAPQTRVARDFRASQIAALKKRLFPD